MRLIAAAIAATALAAPAFAADPAPATNNDGGYSAVQLARYCEKLKEGPQAYAAYVNRMKKMHPYYGFDDLGGTSGGAKSARLECSMAVPMASTGEAAVAAVATTPTTFAKMD